MVTSRLPATRTGPLTLATDALVSVVFPAGYPVALAALADRQADIRAGGSSPSGGVWRLSWAGCGGRGHVLTVFYCDPPYWATEGYGVEFGVDEYVRMAELERAIKGRMVVSVNDIPEMRDEISGLSFDQVDIRYSVGGHRRDSTSSGEPIIRNWH